MEGDGEVVSGVEGDGEVVSGVEGDRRGGLGSGDCPVTEQEDTPQKSAGRKNPQRC